jgi:hypothetical protein
VYAVRRTDYGEIADFAASSLGRRRLKLAQSVALDAKFLTFTKRLTTRSCLQIPLRMPSAPFEGTEEDNDPLRRIVSQGPDFEKFEKYKKVDTFAEMLGLKRIPKKNVLGAYCEQSAHTVPTVRDALYDQLIIPKVDKLQERLVPLSGQGGGGSPSRGTSRAGSRAGTATSSRRSPSRGTAAATAAGGRGPDVRGGGGGLVSRGLGAPGGPGGGGGGVAAVLEVEKRGKIDMVHDKRPRYVSADLLPSNREVSLVETMSKQETARQEALLRKKQGLGTEGSVAAAREMMEAALEMGAVSSSSTRGGAFDPAAEAEAEMAMATTLTGIDAGAAQRKQAAERQVAMRKLFLQKEVVKYGAGRITSTHNTVGKIEEPWNTVQGRYAVLPGDRTG